MDRAAARGLLALTRPANSVLAGLLTFAGAFVAGVPADASAPVAAAVAATVLATAAGMAVNDYFDREVDRINDPHRPIPSGDVAPRTALAFSAALFAGAVALSLTLPVAALAIAVVNLLALVAYTEFFKGLPGVGNAVVAYLVGSTFAFGAAAGGALGPAPVVLAVLAACSTLAREIVKDVEDVAGDREAGHRTLPVVVGERRSVRLAQALVLAAVAASPVPYADGTLGLPYLALVVPADAAMVVAAARSTADPAGGQRLLKWGMAVAAAAFLVGRVAVVG